MDTWIGAPCSSRYTGLLAALPAAPRVAETSGIILGSTGEAHTPRLILRSSTSRAILAVSLSALSARREMGTSTLFLTRSGDDRGLERSPEPHAWAHGDASSFPADQSPPFLL